MSASKKVLVIGGTGFIGYHIVNALLASGYSVSVLCRNAEKAAELFADRATAVSADINILQTADYVAMLHGLTGVVFAAGADERSKVQGDVDEFFYRANVWPCEQLFAALPQTSVKRAVLLSSIFAWLARNKPEMELAQHHPYIRSRLQQNTVAHAAIQHSKCVLTTLEIPWIFGACPHQTSQWAGAVRYVRGGIPLLCIQGGANMMSVQSAAQAVAGALRYPKASSTMPVGDENLSYVALIQKLSALVGREDASVTSVSNSFFHDLASLGNYFSEMFGMQSGIALNRMGELLLTDIFFDPSESQKKLHYAGGDLAQALADTVSAVPEGLFMRSWRQGLQWLEK